MNRLIREQIEAHGPVSFSWFMQQALYHPAHGYYASGRAKIGRDGDFFTNISVGPLFGHFLAAQFSQIWKLLGKPDPFLIVEEGAHDGQLARDILEWAASEAPDFFSAVRYRIVEPFPIWQSRQRANLEEHARSCPTLVEKIEWQTALTPFTGIHVSNELLDAMPIDLRGKAVGLVDGNLALVRHSAPDLTRPNESQLRWLELLAENLRSGVAIVIDYGMARPEFEEMVQARAHHRKLDSAFDAIGEADITAHVNWTDLAEHAQKNGLDLLGFTDQHHFLTGILSVFPTLVSDHTSKPALQTLLHPEMLGRAFQVLALSKGLDPVLPHLAGFKFARDARLLLNHGPDS